MLPDPPAHADLAKAEKRDKLLYIYLFGRVLAIEIHKYGKKLDFLSVIGEYWKKTRQGENTSIVK